MYLLELIVSSARPTVRLNRTVEVLLRRVMLAVPTYLHFDNAYLLQGMNNTYLTF